LARTQEQTRFKDKNTKYKNTKIQKNIMRMFDKHCAQTDSTLTAGLWNSLHL